ncbi:uncharacterized protein IL334_000052 [Kwoniella shivajii]|uniref:Uncharacterized protein n=1 Tax=Kwoniella shivajii TaxID=564305 RepID=A0ABZ1CP41_9TREE|nr:hypothetical protein IL334_000052 [Kwoniella shivajii]
MLATTRLPRLLGALLLVCALIQVAESKRIRATPRNVAVRVPDYLDKWDFTTEFNSLCAGIFPDDVDSNSPILTETMAEVASTSKIRLQGRSSSSSGSSENLFTVSCLYRYSDGEDHQLGSYIAEQAGGVMVDLDEENAHLRRKKSSTTRR